MTSADWIQDSLHERDLRKRGPREPASAFSQRMRNAEGVVGYVWRFGAQIIAEGQNWIVISLVGELPGARHVNAAVCADRSYGVVVL
jgi:hypothetical protein